MVDGPKIKCGDYTFGHFKLDREALENNPNQNVLGTYLRSPSGSQTISITNQELAEATQSSTCREGKDSRYLYATLDELKSLLTIKGEEYLEKLSWDYGLRGLPIYTRKEEGALTLLIEGLEKGGLVKGASLSEELLTSLTLFWQESRYGVSHLKEPNEKLEVMDVALLSFGVFLNVLPSREEFNSKKESGPAQSTEGVKVATNSENLGQGNLGNI